MAEVLQAKQGERSNSEDDDMGCSILILNNSQYDTFYLVDNPEPSSGGYTSFPPKVIKGGQPVTIKARGTSGTSTGVTLTFTYQLGDDKSRTLQWYCDIPYDGGDTYWVKMSSACDNEVQVMTFPEGFSPGHDDYITVQHEVNQCGA